MSAGLHNIFKFGQEYYKAIVYLTTAQLRYISFFTILAIDLRLLV